MKFDYFFQQSFFLLRLRYFKKAISFLRKKYYQIQGMKIGKNTIISKVYCTWPHQVSLGINCTIEQNVYFKYDNMWKEANVTILKGVKIEEGSVVAAGAVVRKSIMTNEIWGGVPAKKIGIR